MGSRRVYRLGLGCSLIFVVACSRSEVIVGVLDPGAPARITFEERGFVGGQGFRTKVTLDSATAVYVVETCTESVGVSCDDTKQVRTGTAQTEVRDELFRRTSMRDFRLLSAEYRRAGSVVPPDPYDAELTITVGERTRTIEWEKGAEVPALVGAYVCNLRAATGELISCPAI